MNGLGLAVCWACCPGPNNGFSTDGQSIVSADAAESKDELIAHEAEKLWMSERTGGASADDSSTTASDGGNYAALNAVRRVVRFPSPEWEPIRKLIAAGDDRSMRLAADKIGIARHLLAKKDSPTHIIVRELAKFGGGDWDILRMRIWNTSTTESGAMLGVTKQAVSKREIAIRAKCAWYDRFVESLANAKRPFFVQAGVITPRKPANPRHEPHGHELRAQAGAREKRSISQHNSRCQD